MAAVSGVGFVGQVDDDSEAVIDVAVLIWQPAFDKQEMRAENGAYFCFCVQGMPTISSITLMQDSDGEKY